MALYERLNLLMQTQGITNSRLSKALSIDASLISRWRNGTRALNPKSSHIQAIAGYFLSHAKQDYQRAAIFEIIGMPYQRDYAYPSMMMNYVINWLLGDSTQDIKSENEAIGKLNVLGPSNPILTRPDIAKELPCGCGVSVGAEVFYGISGKQEGVIRFLSAVASQTKTCTLLLYSDESMEWMTEDKTFYLKWSTLMMDVISKGNKIKIVHNIHRDLTELFSAIERWLPLYMTGSIEPYYNTKYREPVFRRTVFLAPDIAALTSTTLQANTEDAAQFFYTDKSILANLTNEFYHFFSLCRPLMKIFTKCDALKFCELQMNFEEQPGDHISCSDMFSSVTLPTEVFQRLIARSGVDEKLREQLLAIQMARFDAFEKHLEKNHYTEIIIPSSSEVLFSIATLSGPRDFFAGTDLLYLSEEFSAHLENVIFLMQKYENYNLIFGSHPIPSNMHLTAREGVGVIHIKSAASPAAFVFNQQIMTDAFYSYLEDMIHYIPQDKCCKTNTIDLLRRLATDFKNKILN